MLSNGMTSLSLASFSSRNEPAMRSFWSRTPSNQLPPSAHSNIGRRISVVGQNRIFGNVPQMSALPPKADIETRSRNVRFVPFSDDHCIGTYQRSYLSPPYLYSPNIPLKDLRRSLHEVDHSKEPLNR